MLERSPVEGPFERQVARGHRSTSDSAKRQISKNPIFISSFEKIVRFLRGQRLSTFRFFLSSEKIDAELFIKEDAEIYEIPASWHPELDLNQRPTA